MSMVELEQSLTGLKLFVSYDQACGDILTKKKLDPHRNQCRGASFTCIDCMVHFQGTQYRSHTVCYGFISLWGVGHSRLTVPFLISTVMYFRGAKIPGSAL